VGIGDWFRKKREASSAKRDAEAAERIALDAALAAARETTRRPYARISIEQSPRELAPTVSKLGGVPYVPVDAPRPPASMLFLAQLNLADLPTLDFALPRSGILQFWIEDDDTFGLYDERRGSERADGHRCIYHASLDAPQASHVMGTGARGPLCFDEPQGRRLRFEAKTELISPGDYQWDPFLAANGLDPFLDMSDPAVWDEAAGHKVGGYCAFTQTDPRTADDPMWSLLQLDSDEHVFWGDTGIAHWFIRDADLRAGNLANARYYWDCC
jgi:uncharacterized protein YwqG